MAFTTTGASEISYSSLIAFNQDSSVNYQETVEKIEASWNPISESIAPLTQKIDEIAIALLQLQYFYNSTYEGMPPLYKERILSVQNMYISMQKVLENSHYDDDNTPTRRMLFVLAMHSEPFLNPYRSKLNDDEITQLCDYHGVKREEVEKIWPTAEEEAKKDINDRKRLPKEDRGLLEQCTISANNAVNEQNKKEYEENVNNDFPISTSQEEQRKKQKKEKREAKINTALSTMGVEENRIKFSRQTSHRMELFRKLITKNDALAAFNEQYPPPQDSLLKDVTKKAFNWFKTTGKEITATLFS